MGVCVFNVRASLAAGAIVSIFLFIMDIAFSIIVTYIFLEPVLQVLKFAGERQPKMKAVKQLRRTRRWNFAGVIVTVGSGTAMYVNCISFFAATFFQKFYLNDSNWGNPATFGIAVASTLKTLGMILLCGMFKDIQVVPSSIWSISVKRTEKNVSPTSNTYDL